MFCFVIFFAQSMHVTAHDVSMDEITEETEVSAEEPESGYISFPMTQGMPQVGDIVTGTVWIGSYWMIETQSYFEVSQFTGDLATGQVLTVMECIDPTAAHPSDVQGEYRAVVREVNIKEGYVDYDVVIIPPNATDGTLDNDGNLIGYQRIGGIVRVKRSFSGALELRKNSGNPELSDDNPLYSLAGATYGIYDDKEELVLKLITDETGFARANNLSVGVYTVKEITAPKGYALDLKAYGIEIHLNETSHLKVTDMPQNNPIDVIIRKIDSETGQNEPQGAASLADAEFTIRFYAIHDVADDGQDIAATRTWIFKTDEKGEVYFDETYKIAGDGFYYDSTGRITIPLGTITIQETKAPQGYLLNPEVFTMQIQGESDAETLAVLKTQIVLQKYIPEVPDAEEPEGETPKEEPDTKEEKPEGSEVVKIRPPAQTAPQTGDSTNKKWLISCGLAFGLLTLLFISRRFGER